MQPLQNDSRFPFYFLKNVFWNIQVKYLRKRNIFWRNEKTEYLVWFVFWLSSDSRRITNTFRLAKRRAVWVFWLRSYWLCWCFLCHIQIFPVVSINQITFDRSKSEWLWAIYITQLESVVLCGKTQATVIQLWNSDIPTLLLLSSDVVIVIWNFFFKIFTNFIAKIGFLKMSMPLNFSNLYPEIGSWECILKQFFGV